ncbi:MAG: hypothetical protein Q9182_006992 [Xanthomendoza sp. 2 TL-2023]
MSGSHQEEEERTAEWKRQSENDEISRCCQARNGKYGRLAIDTLSFDEWVPCGADRPTSEDDDKHIGNREGGDEDANAP